MNKLKIKHEIYLNNIIERTLKQSQSRELIKNIQETKYNMYENKMPYILQGIVESTFINESDVIKVKEFGCGILIDNNIVLVSSKNLVYEDNTNENVYQLFEVEFTLSNISDEFKQYLPKVKGKDYYTPYVDQKEIANEEQITSSWGLVFLEYPLGDLLNDLNIKINNFSRLINLSSLDNNKIESSEISFLEFQRIKSIENADEESYAFIENVYDMKIDKNLIFLTIKENENLEILPGPIIAYYKKSYFLLGYNSNIIIKLGGEEYDNKNEDTYFRVAIRFNEEICYIINKSINDLKMANEPFSLSIPIFNYFKKVFDKKDNIFEYIKDNCNKLIELLSSLKNDKEKFNINDKDYLTFDNPVFKFIFSLFWNKHFKSEIILERLNIGINGSILISQVFINSESLETINLRNCNIFSEGIKNLINPIFNTKQILYIGRDLKKLILDDNKLCSKSLKYIRHLIKVSPDISYISIANNYITSGGLGYLINCLKDKNLLKYLNFNFNMLGRECGKYLNAIMTLLPSLSHLELQSNNLCNQSSRYLFKSIISCKKLEYLNLANNNISDIKYLSEFLIKRKMKYLNLNNNQIGIEGARLLSQADTIIDELCLNSTNIENKGVSFIFKKCLVNKIHLNNNNLTDESCEDLLNFIIDNKNLSHLYLSNNMISDVGVKSFIEGLLSHSGIKEIYLNGNSFGDEGGELLLYASLYNPNIIKLSIENNNISWQHSDLKIKNIRTDINILF